MKWSPDAQIFEPTSRNLEASQMIPVRSRLWSSYIFKPYGDEVNNPQHWAQQSVTSSIPKQEGPVHPILPPDKFTAVAKWNEQASTAKSNAFKMVKENDGSRQLSSGSRSKTHPVLESQHRANVYKKTERVAFNKEQTVASTGPFMDTPVALSKATDVQALTPPISANAPSVGPVATYAAMQKQASSKTPHEIKPPPIRGPILPKTPDPLMTPNQDVGISDTSRATETASLMAWSNIVVRGERTGDLLGIEPPQSTPRGGNPRPNRLIENRQSETEADTRRYRRDRALRKSPGNIGPRTDAPVVAKIERSTMSLLNLMKSVAGTIRFTVSLGRIYVEGRYVSREHRRHPFPASEWSSVFQPQQGMGHVSTLFSNL